MARQVASTTAQGTPRRMELSAIADRANTALKAGDQPGTVAGLQALQRTLGSGGAAAPGPAVVDPVSSAAQPGTGAAGSTAPDAGRADLATPVTERAPRSAPATGPALPPAPGNAPSATPAQPVLSATAQARALAGSMRIDPGLFAGREEAAVAVMLRLQRFASLSDRDKRFPGFVEAQGFPEGDRFKRAVVGIALDFDQVNPAWAPPGVVPHPVDEGMGERLRKALEVAARDAPEEAKAGLQHLAEPRNVAVMAGIIGVFVAVQLTPAGWVADAVGGVLLLGTALAIGLDVLAILSDLDTFIEGVNSPRGDPERAGKALAHAAGLVAVDVLVALLSGGVAGLARAAKRFVRPRLGEVDVLTSRGGVVRMSARDASGMRKGADLDAMGRSGAGQAPTRLAPGGRGTPEPPRGRELGPVTDQPAARGSGTPEKLPRDALRTEADPARRVMGAAEDSHPQEVAAMMAEFERAGARVVSRSEDLAYAPGRPGEPGDVYLAPRASYSAWLHEYQHFLDDRAAGWRGSAQLMDFDVRMAMEGNAYQREIDLMRKLGHDDVAGELERNREQEFARIRRFFGRD